MAKFVSLETYSINEATGSEGYWLSAKDANNLVSAVLGFIDAKVEELKSEIMSGKYATQKRGTFDRLKNWWYNTIMGQQNQKNPYYKTNLIGRLGQVAEMKLEDYKFLLSEAQKVDNIAVQKTNLDKILDNWSFEFKKQIESRLREFLRNAYVQKAVRKPTKKVTKKIKTKKKTSINSGDSEVVDSEQPTIQNSKEIEIKNLLNKLNEKEDGDIFIGTALEDLESTFAMDLKNNLDTIKNDEAKMDLLLTTLTNYLNNKATKSEFENRTQIKDMSKQFLENIQNYALELEIRKNNYGKKEKLDFNNTTLYERTIECLDKLRYRKI